MTKKVTLHMLFKDLRVTFDTPTLKEMHSLDTAMLYNSMLGLFFGLALSFTLFMFSKTPSRTIQGTEWNPNPEQPKSALKNRITSIAYYTAIILTSQLFAIDDMTNDFDPVKFALKFVVNQLLFLYSYINAHTWVSQLLFVATTIMLVVKALALLKTLHLGLDDHVPPFHVIKKAIRYVVYMIFNAVAILLVGSLITFAFKPALFTRAYSLINSLASIGLLLITHLLKQIIAHDWCVLVITILLALKTSELATNFIL